MAKGHGKKGGTSATAGKKAETIVTAKAADGENPIKRSKKRVDAGKAQPHSTNVEAAEATTTETNHQQPREGENMEAVKNEATKPAQPTKRNTKGSAKRQASAKVTTTKPRRKADLAELNRAAAEAIMQRAEQDAQGLIHTAEQLEQAAKVEEAVVGQQRRADDKAPKASKSTGEAKASTTKPKATKGEVVVNNGVRRPKAGGKCDAVWQIVESMMTTDDEGRPLAPPLADVKKVGEKQGLNLTNVSIEYYRCRQFHGITGRQAANK